MDWLNDKGHIIVLHACWWAYLLFAIIYAEPRVLFVDSAFQFFKIVNFEHLNIEAGRYSTILPQLLLLAGIKLNLGLKTLVVIHSLSYPLIYYAAFIVAIHVFRSLTAAASMLIGLLICAQLSAFHLVTETHQAIIYVALFWGWLEFYQRHLPGSSKSLGIRMSIGILITLLACFSHPMAYFLLPLPITYMLIAGKKETKLAGLAVIVVIVATVIVKTLFSERSWYEIKFMRQLNGWPGHFSNFQNSELYWFLQTRWNDLYLFPVVILVVGALLLLVQRKWVAGGLLLVYLPVLLFLVTLIYFEHDSALMFERGLLPIGLLAGFAISKAILEWRRVPKGIGGIIITMVLWIGTGPLRQSLPFFKERTKYLEQVYDQLPANTDKFSMPQEDANQSMVYIGWGFALETLFHSIIHHPQAPKTLYLEVNDSLLIRDAQLRDSFLYVHFKGPMAIDALNPQYFKLSGDPYGIVNSNYEYPVVN